MIAVKPYQGVPIVECGEPLIPIPGNVFAFFEPHPYADAPYGEESPWVLRKSVLESLIKAQVRLDKIRPGWKIKIFDAYRPVPVQAFMVKRELCTLAKNEGLDPATLRKTDCARLLPQVYRLFARPSKNPLRPPPHSTGGVIDCTLQDEKGHEVNMGSPIDENSNRSKPDYFAAAMDVTGQQAHANRALLNDILNAEGFHRNPSEWWHFSKGDQLAVWVDRAINPKGAAIYGRADLLP